MAAPFFLQALLLGFQHTFEPDHLAAVSVLATSRRSMREDLLPILWRSSQWALGHGLTLMLLSGLALLFKSSLPLHLSEWVELWVIGPMMIGLGLLALWRAATLYSHAHPHDHDEPVAHDPHDHGDHGAHDHGPHGPAHVGSERAGHDHLHAHVAGERITIFNRSFGIGMLHGAAGTGGALAVALGLAADSVATAIGILILESVGVLIAMSGYALLLVFMAKRMARSHTWMLRGVNLVVGLLSIGVGVVWLQRGFA